LESLSSVMKNIRRRAHPIYAALFIAVLAGCQHGSDRRNAQPYMTRAGAVGFEVMTLGSTGGSRLWLATYNDGSSSSKFRIELSAAKTVEQNCMWVGIGQGKLLAESGSEPLAMIGALQSAFAVGRLPKGVKKVDELTFDYTVIGENQSQSTGGFSSEPKGNWTVMKVRSGKAPEFFLNVDAFDHKAEFALVDPGSGASTLAELAKVL
jgi:hypothetical protein